MGADKVLLFVRSIDLAEREAIVLGNMSLWMEDTDNRLISEPVPIGSDQLEGHICKYAEESYVYKYDLGHIF